MPLTDEQRRHLEARLLEERDRARGTLEQYDERPRTTPREEIPFERLDAIPWATTATTRVNLS